MQLAKALSVLAVLQTIAASPVPRLITRVHTADPTTTTATYTTGTTTVHLPPVEVLVSKGKTYTFTLSDQATATEPTTTTSTADDEATGSPDTPENTQADNQATQAETTAQATQETTGNAPADTQAETTANETTSADTAETTQADTAEATQDTAESTQDNAETTPAETTPAETTPAETTPAETTPAETTDTQAETTAETTDTQAETTAETAETSQETTAAETSVSASSGAISPPTAIVYSPYQNDGGCKDEDSINSDLELIHSKGIKRIRTYGCDCGSVSVVLPKASKLGMKVNQGFWFGKGQIDDVDGDVQKIIDYANDNGWDVFDFFTIGNEAINDNFASVDELSSKISSVKSKLKDAGYSGKVTTSEPPSSYINNPSLCTKSDIDFVGLNSHSYFNTKFFAYQAGTFVKSEKKLVEGICGGKDVFVTETGYPHEGDTNGDNVPSTKNQEIAIKSIIDQLDGDVTILSTFDDPWKPAGEYNVERYFGSIKLFS
ncbi:glycoside hydrolase [Hyphopichia burtonii NRRL Y-1933]|uniref:Glycoside hydrolase n=1 Tax=Hyphopichia burtonii NRRL Y-1933 TaxID=984485 RepID=A0A1E4RD70_9ASCO|nr:glycoside hydrolase [Hyphopichia burtonii NRRL Y-1933]ODV65208.1 glycoside hydrolase [Hyphopichia burtonii NRRL Y-1933]